MSRGTGRDRGFTALELLFVVALTAIMSSIAVPPVLRALDDYRAAGAARYVATRLQRVRMEASLRSADVGARFSTTSSGYVFAVYVDGNRNGVLTSDIYAGTDRQLGAVECLSDNFSGVDFGTWPGLPAVDSGSSPPGTDPIRLGSSDIASFSASGSSSSGSLYIKSRSKQYVVRLYGDTGKTRILVFDETTRQWKPL
jgi:prepilin-type N-terminal cleavage/methylation domain-containing protein